MIHCPLCHSHQIIFYHQDAKRLYNQCTQCHLVFVPKKYHLSSTQEKTCYDFHQNLPNDPQYRAFLNRLFIPVNQKIKKGSFGLDFGSGPGPTLNKIFEEAGHQMKIYDFFYAKHLSVFKKKYDFITASEVIEHLSDPCFELNRLWACLKKNGVLGFMTKMVKDADAFQTWHYNRDPTHICFYSHKTFKWLSHIWMADLKFVGDDVALFFSTCQNNLS